VEEKRLMTERGNESINLSRQLELLDLSRSSFYYKSKGESSYNLGLMKLIDKEYTDKPYYGVKRITAYLKREGYSVNVKRVRRLMRKMGLIAIYPKKKTSISNKSHKKYPYLLKNYRISKANDVWSIDITYIPVKNGMVYLVAIIDWYSRYVLSWRLSNTMSQEFCIDALKEALEKGTPKIFNTDQGSQFTSNLFTGILLEKGIMISMDSKGRAFDNIFVERLWRTVKYEDIYIKDYQSMKDTKIGLKEYFIKYNNERLHQSLDYNTPNDVFFKNITNISDIVNQRDIG
jgi:putative transposase